ncbi:MAG: hypothetical protein ACP5I6_06615 [Caldisphaera sp.]|jgi:hypothetical protein|nr:MAG: hypothetical protein C0172_03460 [Caldisphaera sp.]
MTLEEQYYDFIWNTVRKGLDSDGIISLNIYNKLLKNFLEKYKGKNFFDLPLVYRFYLVVEAFLYTTIEQVLSLIQETDEYSRDIENLFNVILKVLDGLLRDVSQEQAEYKADILRYKKIQFLMDFLRYIIYNYRF